MAEFLTTDAEFVCSHGQPFQVSPLRSGVVRMGGTPVMTLAGLVGARLKGKDNCGIAETGPTVACRLVTAVVTGLVPTAGLDGSPLLTTEAKGFASGLPPGLWQVKASGQGVARWQPGGGAAITVPAPPAVAVSRRRSRWVEVELVYRDGTPVEGQEYRLLMSNKDVVTGWLDKDGRAWIDGLPAGDCRVTFPGLDDSSWGPG